ncbi:MAG: hypothetical protein M0R30_08405 [Methanoregula sp.]|jgi:hypothetical protein|uniref:hypothetical protein n=1 Tax=Methanoregula sp. TaxID=2052170 RepID=UPI0025D086E8|nr:hypothetical protein [Methanoregula sp.]MCK9631653.1 hypothetical protein [Methanoregula sp.]
MADPAQSPESQGKQGWSTGTKVLVGVIALIFIVAVIAIVTLSIAVAETQAGTSFPYTTTYRVSIPDGEPVTIGSTRILVMTYENEVMTEVDGVKEKLITGQERVISPRSAKITALGIPLMDTDFQITLTYLGTSGKNALFDMNVRTSRQVPELVVSKLIPSSMNAQPA